MHWSQEADMNAVDRTDDRYAMFDRDSDHHHSRSPLNVAAHGDWCNPLSMLPLGILLIVAVDVILAVL
jgi:hypothetical protein